MLITSDSPEQSKDSHSDFYLVWLELHTQYTSVSFKICASPGPVPYKLDVLDSYRD